MKGNRAVIELLKASGDEMKLSEIVDKTKDVVEWPAVPTNFMNRLMETHTRIVRVNPGYYKYKQPAIKKAPPESEPEQISISDTVSQPEPTVVIEQKSVEYRPRSGVPVDAVVMKVMSYGVFVDLIDYPIGGLLHVSNMKRGTHFWRMDDIERHFQIGDELKVKLLMYRSGKASFCTYDLPLPDHGQLGEESLIAEKLAPVAAAIREAPKPAPVKTAPSYVSTATKDELEDLYEIIRKKVGVISLNAKDALREIVKKNGSIVKVTLALMAIDDFEADVSLAFVRHLEAKANGGL